MELHGFDLLTPFAVADSVESAFGIRTDGSINALTSYVNRVYGLIDEEGAQYVAKFYRPGRWTREAIQEEHELVADCVGAELPVVAPIAGVDGATLQSIVAGEEESEREFLFALFPKRGGRNFDAERDEDWVRLGALVGRLHSAAKKRQAVHRLICTPAGSTRRFLEDLRNEGVVHPDAPFFELADEALARISPLFEGIATQRIHGDCHRGNILDRADEGLLLIDFDDMMMGPPVQDLWLLLPDRADKSERELSLILEGYEQFLPFDGTSLALIEPLRVMRMIYYLTWSALQREDHRFHENNPEWGSRAFWIKEVEDLRDQLDALRA